MLDIGYALYLALSLADNAENFVRICTVLDHSGLRSQRQPVMRVSTLLATAGVLLLAPARASASSPPPSHDARPNLLFLQCDEMDGRVLDPSHPLSRVTSMPHLTALAARGVNFVRTYAENPLCAPSRASTWTGRRTASIRTWNNVKALTTMIGAPAVADATCASVVGYGYEWCVAEGKKQNVSSLGSIRHALVDLGYRVQLCLLQPICITPSLAVSLCLSVPVCCMIAVPSRYGKMDTGGGVCRPEVDDCIANGYHDSGNWSADLAANAPPPLTYFHGDLIHSWAGAAGISKAVFQPLLAENGWINETNPNGGPFAHDWPTIRQCVDWIGALDSPSEIGGGDSSPWALYCSICDPHPPYFVRGYHELSRVFCTHVRHVLAWRRCVFP